MQHTSRVAVLALWWCCAAALAVAVAADQHALGLHHLHPDPMSAAAALPPPARRHRRRRKRVAIVGAGPGGASFAYFASRAFRGPAANRSEAVELHVYDVLDRAGGRCHSAVLPVAPELNLTANVEWGASIFVKENAHLVAAAKRFNLTLVEGGVEAMAAGSRADAEPEKGGSVLAFWDGARVIFSTDLARSGEWRERLKLVRRYGLRAPWAVTRAANSVASKLAAIYASAFPAIDTWGRVVRALGLDPEVGPHTAEQWLAANAPWSGAPSGAFVKEMVEGITRTNYGRGLDEVHAAAALVGFVDGPTYSVLGGNQQLHERYLEHAGVEVHWRTRVRQVERVAGTGEYVLHVSQWKHKSTRGTADTASTAVTDPYDAIVLAVPLHQVPPIVDGGADKRATCAAAPGAAAGSDPLHNANDVGRACAPNAAPLPHVEYHKIHVTFVLGLLNTTTFPDRPAIVLTTRPDGDSSSSNDNAAMTRLIQSVSRVADYGAQLGKGVALYKVFSTQPIVSGGMDKESAAWASKTARTHARAQAVVDPRLISTLFERVDKAWTRSWLSYPVMRPQPAGQDDDAWYPKLVLDEPLGDGNATLAHSGGGVFLLNGFERFLSTMETATVAARNAVRVMCARGFVECNDDDNDHEL